MSTQKVLAKKVVGKPNYQYPIWNIWFETEEGRKFRMIPLHSPPLELKGQQVYLCKKLNVVRSNLWAYEIYPVPTDEQITPYGRWKWRGSSRVLVYETDK